MPLLLLQLGHAQLLAATLLLALDRQISEEAVAIVHGRHRDGNEGPRGLDVDVILREECMVIVEIVQYTEQEIEISQLLLDVISQRLHSIDTDGGYLSVCDEMRDTFINFIGHLLSRRGIWELNHFHLMMPGEPYLACSDVLQKLETHNIFFKLWYEKFIALHRFVIRHLIIHGFIPFLAAEHGWVTS